MKVDSELGTDDASPRTGVTPREEESERTALNVSLSC